MLPKKYRNLLTEDVDHSEGIGEGIDDQNEEQGSINILDSILVEFLAIEDNAQEQSDQLKNQIDTMLVMRGLHLDLRKLGRE